MKHHWKEFKCPTCGVSAGHSCGKIRLGTIGQWVTTAPHAARKRLATLEDALDNFARVNEDVWQGVNTEKYMNEIRERD